MDNSWHHPKYGFLFSNSKSICHDERNSQIKILNDIAVDQYDLYISSPSPEDIVNTLKAKYKLSINVDYHLGANYPNDLGGTMICQLKKILKSYMINSLNFSKTTLLST